MPISSKMNPDIKEERDKVSFNVEELTNWIYGSADKVKEKRFLGKFTTCCSLSNSINISS